MIARREPCAACGRAVMLVWRAGNDVAGLEREPDQVVHTERIDGEVDGRCTWPRSRR